MTRIDRGIVIWRRPEVVFALLSDLAGLPGWATIVVEMHDLPARPLRNGDTFRQTVQLASRTLESDWRMAELETGRHVVAEATVLGSRQWTIEQTMVPCDDGSQVEPALDYELPGGLLGNLVDRVCLERRNAWEVEHALEYVRDLLGGRAERPGWPQ